MTVGALPLRPAMFRGVFPLCALTAASAYDNRRLATDDEIPQVEEPYSIFWQVSGPNSSVFDQNGSVDVEQYGIKPLNWSVTGAMSSFWPQLGGANGQTPQHGGVPQAANLSLHLQLLTAAVEAQVPDSEWAGLAIFDFEEYTPLWANAPFRYQNLSRHLVEAAHPSWRPEQIEAQAKTEFEAASTEMYVATLRRAAALRTRALWGYYNLPSVPWCRKATTQAECYLDSTRPASSMDMQEALSDARQLQPVLAACGALFPSIYLTDSRAPTSEVTNSPLGGACLLYMMA